MAHQPLYRVYRSPISFVSSVSRVRRRRASPDLCRASPRNETSSPLVTPPIAGFPNGNPRARKNGTQEDGVSLFEPASFLIISGGIFAGAVVSGLMGFAFSAVAGAILLHVLPPTEAVPLMMACSIVTQAVSLVALRGSVQWRGSPGLLI